MIQDLELPDFHENKLCASKNWGNHLNSYYNVLNSKSAEFLDCKKDHCSCGDENRCTFTQGYGEGSAYYGFWINETVYFDENRHEEDKVRMTVGWVFKETKLFYSQQADGIMGLSTAGNLKSKPIYYHLYDEGLIEHLEFSLWFGHNGGRFTVGGYDEKLIIKTQEKWVKDDCQEEDCQKNWEAKEQVSLIKNSNLYI